jgi:hypothetical protein
LIIIKGLFVEKHAMEIKTTVKLNAPAGWKQTRKDTSSFIILDYVPETVQWIRSVRICIRKAEPRPDVPAEEMLKERYRKRHGLAVDASVDVAIHKLNLYDTVFFYFLELDSMPEIYSVYGIIKTVEGKEIHLDIHKEDLGEIEKDTFDADYKKFLKLLLKP